MMKKTIMAIIMRPRRIITPKIPTMRMKKTISNPSKLPSIIFNISLTLLPFYQSTTTPIGKSTFPISEKWLASTRTSTDFSGSSIEAIIHGMQMRTSATRTGSPTESQQVSLVF